ncbi:MAG: hypothetical protein HY999_03420 [Nitrospinae bacterium]|nr:hypothetical protein [Nitrospinota bacterium]
MSTKNKIPSFIHIYGKGSIKNPNLDILASEISDRVPGIGIDIREDIFSYLFSLIEEGKRRDMVDSLARMLAGIRVLDPAKKGLNPDPIYGEIDYERRKILNQSSSSIGVFYDGFELGGILYSIIPKGEQNLRHLHIIFTNQLFATWDENDLRYHTRVAIYGVLSIISITGMVEAPAKPREYYLARRFYTRDQLSLTEFKRGIGERFIEYDDKRMTDVMKGYIMQSLFYYLIGSPFCEDRSCRLFNAHWQEEVINAQLDGDHEYCETHRRILDKVRER